MGFVEPLRFLRLMGSRGEKGFTLVELVIAVVVIAIIGALGVPMLRKSLNDYRLKGATYIARNDMQNARMAAIKTNGSITMSVQGTTGYQYSYTDSNGQSHVFFRQLSSDYPGVTVSIAGGAVANSVTFNSQGLAGNPGNSDITVTLQGSGQSKSFIIRWTGGIQDVSA